MFESSLSQILIGAVGSLFAAGILVILTYLRSIHAQLKELPNLRLDVKALEKTGTVNEKRIAENEKRYAESTKLIAENTQRYDESTKLIAENAQRIAENEAKHIERIDAFEATQNQLVNTVNTLLSKVERLDANMHLVVKLVRDRTEDTPTDSEQN